MENLKNSICHDREYHFGSCTGPDSYCFANDCRPNCDFNEGKGWDCFPDCLAINKLSRNPKWALTPPVFQPDVVDGKAVPGSASLKKAKNYCDREGVCEWRNGQCSWAGPHRPTDAKCGVSFPGKFLDDLVTKDGATIAETPKYPFSGNVPANGMNVPDQCKYMRYGGGNAPIEMEGRCQSVGIITRVPQFIKPARCLEKCETRQNEPHCMSRAEGGRLYHWYQPRADELVCIAERNACVTACADSDGDGFKDEKCQKACKETEYACHHSKSRSCDTGLAGGPTFQLNADGRFANAPAGFIEMMARATSQVKAMTGFGGLDITNFGKPGPKVPQDCLGMCRWIPNKKTGTGGKCFTSCEAISNMADARNMCKRAGCRWEHPRPTEFAIPVLPFAIPCTGTPSAGAWPTTPASPDDVIKQLEVDVEAEFLAQEEAPRLQGLAAVETATECITTKLFQTPNTNQQSKEWKQEQELCLDKVKLELNTNYEEPYMLNSHVGACRPAIDFFWQNGKRVDVQTLAAQHPEEVARLRPVWEGRHINTCPADTGCGSECKESNGDHTDQSLKSERGVTSWGTENCVVEPAFPINFVLEVTTNCKESGEGNSRTFSCSLPRPSPDPYLRLDANAANGPNQLEEMARKAVMGVLNGAYAYEYGDKSSQNLPNRQTGHDIFQVRVEDIVVNDHDIFESGSFGSTHVLSMNLNIPAGAPPDAYSTILGDPDHNVQGLFQDRDKFASDVRGPYSSHGLASTNNKKKLFGNDVRNYDIQVRFSGARKQLQFKSCYDESIREWEDCSDAEGGGCNGQGGASPKFRCEDPLILGGCQRTCGACTPSDDSGGDLKESDTCVDRFETIIENGGDSVGVSANVDTRSPTERIEDDIGRTERFYERSKTAAQARAAEAKRTFDAELERIVDAATTADAALCAEAQRKCTDVDARSGGLTSNDYTGSRTCAHYNSNLQSVTSSFDFSGYGWPSSWMGLSGQSPPGLRGVGQWEYSLPCLIMTPEAAGQPACLRRMKCKSAGRWCVVCGLRRATR